MLTIFALIAIGRAPQLRPLTLRDSVVDKNFYGLSLMLRDPGIVRELESSPQFDALQRKKREIFRAVAAATTLGRSDQLAQLLWSDSEMDSVADEFERLGNSDPLMRGWIKTTLRPSHAYYRFESLGDGPFLAQVWRDCARGLNHVVRIYGTQTDRGPSPEINGPIYRTDQPLYGGLVRTVLDVILEAPLPTFFGLSLQLGGGVLRAQVRDEAARHEPLERGENRRAVQRAQNVHWADYAYTALVVPGFGPEEANVSFSPIGRLGCELAARRWRAKVAPYILTSGGYVHPDRTSHCEALEMKRCLMEEFGVPEEAILVDPHARHTTTNIRNAVRILARDGMPTDRPFLVVTNAFQASDIASASFEKRCQGVFGYLPFQSTKRIGNFEVSVVPNLTSLSIDPTDPLDP